MLLQGCGSFPSVFLRARWPNLVRVECFKMIKPMVVDLDVDATLGDGFIIIIFFYSQKELGFTMSYLHFFLTKL